MSFCRTLGLAVALWAASVLAQDVTGDREVDLVKDLYYSGRFTESLSRAESALNVIQLSDTQSQELHQLAALSAFNLNNRPLAERHFLSVLQKNPDAVLDVYAVPPPAIALFEGVKKKNADSLNLVRQQLALREEKSRREREERLRQERSEEEQRRRIEDITRKMMVRTVEKRSLIVNFLPFGAGQFQQGRMAWGATFAIAETALGMTSLLCFVIGELQYESTTYRFYNALTSGEQANPLELKVRRVPEGRKNTFEILKTIKLISGIGFYLVWALGILEALLRYNSEVVTTTYKPVEKNDITPTRPMPPPVKPQSLIQKLNPRLGAFANDGMFGMTLGVRLD